ncbi:hypothetical protein IE53DRAFT_372168, partial [Violaceomyces palustris]
MSALLRARKALRVEGSASDDQSRAQAMLQNKDLLPVPPERRTWSSINFVS